jgi:hypothetical protein
MTLDAALNKAQATVPECVATAYIDMATGMLLGVKTVDSHPAEVLELVAAATADLFQGQNVTTIEQMFKKARGVADDGNHYFKEILVLSDNLLHVFLRTKKYHDHVFVVVCRKSANLGMVLSKSRICVGDVEAAV